MECVWKENFLLGKLADPNECGKRILELWNANKHVDKEDIVADSLVEGSPFHSIIWKDSDDVAARKYRLDLAGEVLRSIELITYKSDGSLMKVRLVENLIVETTSPTQQMVQRNTYVPIQVIRAERPLFEQLLQELDRIIDTYREKRNKLIIYANGNEAILDAIKTLDDKIQKP
jgi:hypothetical protein